MEDENLVILNLEITQKNKAIGKKIAALNIPNDAVVTAIFRNKKAVIPKGSTLIEYGDRIVVTTLKKAQSKVVKVLS